MNIYLLLGIMLAGLALHFGKKMMEFEDNGTAMSPIDYAKVHPWRIFVTIGTCIAAVLVLNEMGEMNKAAAFFTGFSGSSAFDTLRAKANASMEAMVNTAVQKSQ